jgi:hypothetical protein
MLALPDCLLVRHDHTALGRKVHPVPMDMTSTSACLVLHHTSKETAHLVVSDCTVAHEQVLASDRFDFKLITSAVVKLWEY